MNNVAFSICFQMGSFSSYLQQWLLSFIYDLLPFTFFKAVISRKIDITALQANNCFCRQWSLLSVHYQTLIFHGMAELIMLLMMGIPNSVIFLLPKISNFRTFWLLKF